MEDLDKLMLMDDVMEDMEKIKRLEFGSDEWKKVQDSIDKRYNTTLAEIRMSVELDEKEQKMELEKLKALEDIRLRELETKVADKKSKRELIGKIVGVTAGVLIVGFKWIYDNSEHLFDKFTADQANKMINSK